MDQRPPVDPLKLAWLLRVDLRRGLLPSDPIPDWFRIWWQMDGTLEYPEWPRIRSDTSTLLRPIPEWPCYGQFGMTPALRYLLETRMDLRDQFDASTEAGLWRAIAWFYTHGLREYKLMEAADEITLNALDAVPPFLEVFPAGNGPALTWLMYFVWFSSNELRNTFDLRSRNAQLDYIQWFLFEGVPNLRLAALVAPRWRDWLKTQLNLVEFSPMILARAGYLIWRRRVELQEAFNLKSPRGQRDFAEWLANAWEHDPALSWTNESEKNEIDNPFPPRPFGLNLIGFAFGELGIGEDIRMAAEACERAGIPFAVVNVNPGENLRQNDRILQEKVQSAATQMPAPFNTNLYCMTAFDTARVILERGPSLCHGRVNIGWWPWELPVFPKDWHVVFDLVDEVWAATSFTKKMYDDSVKHAGKKHTRVRLMPMAASVRRKIDVSREELKLPRNVYLYLYVFDFNSYLIRKNPFALVRAFKEAFKYCSAPVGLVLKTMNSRPKDSLWNEFILECKSDPRISLIDTTLSREKVLGLIDTCDAYVSLHKSEGFGRTIAEALLLGKQVAATNFSGNVDFLCPKVGHPILWQRESVRPGDYPFVTPADNAWWAAPDEMHAAETLALMYKSRKSFSSRKVKNQAKRYFSPRVCGARMLAALKTRQLPDNQ